MQKYWLSILAAIIMTSSPGVFAADVNSTPCHLQCDFEQSTSLEQWNDDAHIASIDGTECYTGQSSLHIDIDSKENASIFTSFPVQRQKSLRARLLKISFFVKTNELPQGSLVIRLLKWYEQGKGPEWYTYAQPDFFTVPSSPTWTKVQTQALVDDLDFKGFNIYFAVKNATGNGSIWIDDLSVDLTEQGIIFQGGTPRTIFPSENGQVQLIISSPDAISSGSVTLYNEAHKRISVAEIPQNQASIPVSLHQRGYYELEAQVKYRDGTQCTASTSAVVAGPLLPDALRMTSPFGIANGGDDASLAAGARWDRRFLSPGSSIFQKAADTGYTVPTPPLFTSKNGYPSKMTSLYCLFPPPIWLQDRSGNESDTSPVAMYPIKDTAAFDKLMAYVVQNLSDKPIEYVEIANEPDWHGPRAGLVEYSRLFSAAVKRANPQVKVIGPSFPTIEIPDMQSLKDLGYFDFIDGVCMHAYVLATPPENEFIKKVQDLKAFLASIGKKEMPIYISEYGWTIPPGDWQKPVDPLTQARYVSRSLILLVSEQVRAIEWFNMWYGNPLAMGYALMNYDRTPRPSFAAYANVSRCLTGVTGPGHVLKVTPTTYLALFRKGSGIIAAAWDVQNSSSVFVPQPSPIYRNMFGSPVKNGRTSSIPVSPSPVFIESTDRSFYGITNVQTVQARQGETIKLPWVPRWVPSPLQVTKRQLTIPQNTQTGTYLLIGKTLSGWQSFTVNVVTALTVDSAEVIWPASQETPSVHAKITSFVPEPIDASCRVLIDGVDAGQSSPILLEGMKATALNIDLPKLIRGKRYHGIISISVTGKPLHVETPFDILLTSCEPLSTRGSEIDWSAIPAVSSLTPWALQQDIISPTDCSAQLQVGYTSTGLCLRARVCDNSHVQSCEPSRMWSQDSIQVAFDMDADQPLEPNKGGWNGHFRIFEYGAALGSTGPMTWRWLSYHNTLPADCSEPRITANITRSGEITTYDLAFPWIVLGRDRQPSKGTRIGFSLVVNDADQGTSDRKVLALYGGIAERKDPALYGTLWVR